MEKEKFEGAFKNNYYLTEEYAKFCSKVTGLETIKHNDVWVLGNKVVGISNYSEKDISGFEGFEFASVVFEEDHDYIMEYPILFADTYEKVYKNYDRTFKKNLRRSEKYGFVTKAFRKIDEKLVDLIYPLYVEQMKRLCGFVFPKYFFVEFMKLDASILFVVYHENDIAGFSFCLENDENLYTSIGSGVQEYFDMHVNYVLYDKKIRYACSKRLNVHMGIGMKGSGYNEFKKRVGAKCFGVMKDNEHHFLLSIHSSLSKSFLRPLLSLVLSYYSKRNRKKVVYSLMPFT